MLSDILQTDWLQVFDVMIRSILSLSTLFLITKMLGKKQVSELSVFDYVIGISIGNFAAEMTINLQSQYMNGIVAVVMFGLVAYLVALLTLKSIMLRRFFMGVPTVVIEKGKMLKKNMSKIKLDMNDLLEECRTKGFFDVADIEYAIVEVNGELSILPKEAKRPLTVEDMNLSIKQKGLCANVIIDGHIMNKNIVTIKKSKEWLMKELNKQGYKTHDKILLATVDINYKLNVYPYNENIQSSDVLE
jgi:uncharacterized membrane protein YcaP (DUF421 family)